jgi:alkylation response protein AidB-like acyl-CoA dehydrogenase
VANWIFVLARTDPEASKHKGITFFLVPMDQPGVEVRPIKMMTGWSEFNETFFTDARTARDNVVGAVNAGWSVAMTLLGYERGEAAATFPIMFRAEIDRLLDLARSSGAAGDPIIRQRLADCYAKVEIMRYLGMRTLTKFLAGAEPGPAESSFKLYWSEYHQEVTELAVDILGASALAPTGRVATSFRADDVGAPNDSASWATTFLMSRAGSIYAGSSQVQRNILGEMVLDLPKEPRPAAQQGSWRDAQSAG